MKKVLLIALFIGLIIDGWAVGKPRVDTWLADREASKLPPAVNISTSIVESITAPAVEAVANRYGEEAVDSVTIPAEKNLNVPFTSQAPHANWDLDHNEFCEEASALMVGRFFQRRDIVSQDDAEAGLQAIKKWEVENLGFYYDTTAAETARILEELYKLKVELKVNPTIEDIKRAIAHDRLVIVPSAGRELGNPNFTAPGPIYHMLVIRGYTKDGKFITNDPGTRKGEQYVYRQQVVMDAIHNWVPRGDRTIAANGDVAQGARVILIVSPAEKE